MAASAAGLAAGLALATAHARAKQHIARQHMNIAARLLAQSEQTLLRARELSEPPELAARPAPAIPAPRQPQVPATTVRSPQFIQRLRDTMTRETTLPDWAPGELLAAFADPEPATAELPLVVPTPAPAPVWTARHRRAHWAPGPGTPRDAAWRVFDLVPPIPVPPLPRPFQVPRPRRPINAAPTPALLAALPPDPTRCIRTRTLELAVVR
jgi:hypothetical protein